MRFVVGGIEHETRSFAAAGATKLMNVARTQKYGDELRPLGDANTILDGLVGGVRETEHELVPLLWIDATITLRRHDLCEGHTMTVS